MQLTVGTGWPPAQDRARMIGMTTPVGPDEVDDEVWNWGVEPPREPRRIVIPARQVESSVWYFVAGVGTGFVITVLGVVIGAVT